MSVFSDANINKLVALLLIVAILIVYVCSGIFKFSIPTAVDTITGVAIGYAAHALGVVNGVQAVNTAAQIQQPPTMGK